MTEKRFVLYEHKGADYILDTPNTELDFIEMLGDCLDEEEIVDLLNELDEKYVDEFALRETLQQELQRSEEENEQLKIRFNEEREKSLKFCRNIDTLTIENEKLKSEIEDLNDILAGYEEKELQK